MSMADQTCPTPAARSQAVLAADVVDGVTIEQFDPTAIRRMAREVAAAHGGRIVDAFDDKVIALFGSTVDAVRGALAIQARLRETASPSFSRLRIGVHVGKVLFQGDRPFGETLIVASLLESLAHPGGVLVSSEVKEAAAPRLAATFEGSGVKNLMQARRRIATFNVGTGELSPRLAIPPDAALNETLLHPPQDAMSGAEPPRPKGESARSAPLSAAPPDAALNETVLHPPQGQSAGETTAKARDNATGASVEAHSAPTEVGQSVARARRPTSATPAASGADTTGTPTSRPVTLDETILSPKDGAPGPRRAATLPPQVKPISNPLAPGDWRGPLTRLLAMRLGPMAPLIVNHERVAVATLAELIDRLAEKIPSSRDRAEFRDQAERLLPRSEP
jgi:hypothetical protein